MGRVPDQPADATEPRGRAPRLSAARREGERVTPLELFFDLVFVLAITQCTALMSHHPTWSGLIAGAAGARRALVGLGRLRLADQRHRPRGGRGAAGHLRRDGGAADRLALRAGGVRQPRPSPSPCDRRLPRRPHRPLHARQPRRRRPAPLGPRARRQHRGRGHACSPPPRSSTASRRGRSGLLALFLDMGGPYLFGSEGWKLVPGHFAERHGLIVIIALGESIVAIGVGAAGAPRPRDRRRRRARRRPGGGDVVDLLRHRRPGLGAAPGRSRGRARSRTSWPATPTPTSTSLLVAGIVLVAFGLKTTIAHTDEHLARRPRLRPARRRRPLPARPGRLPLPPHPHRQPPAPRSRDRAADPDPGRDGDPGAGRRWRSSTALLWAMIAYEHRSYGEGRDQLRHEVSGGNRLRSSRSKCLTNRVFDILRNLEQDA